MLNAHNTYRKMHGCKPYLLSPELCRTAQEHAKKLGINGKQAKGYFLNFVVGSKSRFSLFENGSDCSPNSFLLANYFSNTLKTTILVKI